MQVSVRAAASTWQLRPPKLAKAKPWWAHRKVLHAQDSALVLRWLAYGHGMAVATSQSLAA